MFGCVVAGRPLVTQLTQVDETHAYFELSDAASINHISTFLLGTVPFPDGYGCTVHFYWPGKGFQLLGMLSNEKPSAIFRLRGSFSTQISAAFTVNGLPAGGVTAMLGFSIEPLDAIASQIAGLSSAGTVAKPVQPMDSTLLAERIVKHLFAYIAGFTGGSCVGPESAIPMSLFAKWYESFIGKIKAGGVKFLERED